MSDELQKDFIIALDAMGGDRAPAIVLEGADIFLRETGACVGFRIYGDEKEISGHIGGLKRLKQCCDIIHADDSISSDEKPSVALRKGKNSSMRLAIDAVRNSEASAVVSAGNTGALMAMSKLVLRTLPSIDRPAITSVMPTRSGKCVMLDLGANIDCNADNLVQFAVMGDAFAKIVLGVENPKIGLLNIGSEEVKGSEVIRTAASELKNSEYPINFHGYVEGDQIAEGIADVIVTDGFTGNVALKTAEGTAKICADYMKQGLSGSLLAMIGGFLARSCLKKTFKKLDPRLYNGAIFLGLNGIAVKSHGGTDEIGFANALKVAYDLCSNDINYKINSILSFYD